MISYLRRIFPWVLIGLIPLALLFFGYIWLDPFMVVHRYESFSNANVIPNRDYVSTEMYKNNREAKGYNSFIFGSSRALAFKPAAWKRYLQGEAVPFLFDASGESLYGILAKLRYIEGSKGRLDNALVLLCRDGAFDSMENPSTHLNIKHPSLSRESPLYFHYVFFKSYLNLKFLASYYLFKMDGRFRPFMSGLIETRRFSIDPEDNSLVIVDQEDEILKSQEEYYLKRAALFNLRRGERIDSIPRITGAHQALLREVKEILERNNTDYRIILSPLYDQVRFNENDLDFLHALFGDKLSDFTGKSWITDQVTNWYEPYHFRPFVADSIMSEVYSGR